MASKMIDICQNHFCRSELALFAFCRSIVSQMLKLLATIIIIMATIATSKMIHPLQQTVQCHCGKVKIGIDANDVLRLVCYCKDCRGYYNSINALAAADSDANRPSTTTQQQAAVMTAVAQLDPWGGCDYTHLFPNEMNVLAGKENMQVVKIREKSQINRCYASCCRTPLFSIGPSKTVLLNTHLIDDPNKAEVRFRIIGRNALVNKEATEKRPSMSWSVPLAWFWTMPGRASKDKTAPLPVEIPDKVSVLENFKQG